MLAWIIVAGWFFIGLCVGRYTFTKILGNNPRYCKSSSGTTYTTNEYDAAIASSASAVPFWPIHLIYFFLTQSTKNEKLAQREKELEKQRKELEKFAAEHDLELPEGWSVP